MYRVQTRLCVDREHEIGANLISTRTYSKYTNKISRVSRQDKRQKPGECDICKYEKLANTKGYEMTDDNPHQNVPYAQFHAISAASILIC